MPQSSSRTISPDAHDAHHKADPADTRPHKLEPLLITRLLLDLFAIDLADLVLNHPLLHRFVHQKVQTSTGRCHESGPDEVRVSHTGGAEEVG